MKKEKIYKSGTWTCDLRIHVPGLYQLSYLALHWRSPYFVNIFVRGRQSEVMKPYTARDLGQVTIQPGKRQFISYEPVKSPWFSLNHNLTWRQLRYKLCDIYLVTLGKEFTIIIIADVMTDLYTYINPRNDKPSPLISQLTYDIIIKNKEVGFHFDNLSGHLVDLVDSVSEEPILTSQCQFLAVAVNLLLSEI